jgi:tripartite-type tricarboxylate transporter receptor subunit TctC
MKKILLAVVLSFVCAQAQSQGWPAKPVKIIVPNAPGTAPDVAARMLSDKLSRSLGQAFPVENNTAGSGIVASQQVARATPDGYTLFQGSSSSLVSNPYVFKSVGYDTLKDFMLLGHIAETPFMMAVHPDVPAKTVAEWIALAKSQPGKLSYAADAGVAAIVGKWFNKTAGIDTVHVPYKQLAPSVQDTVGGRTQMIIVSAQALAAMIKAGKLRPIALTSAQRYPSTPDLPTVAETLPGFAVGGWFSLAAPSGLPVPIAQRLNDEVHQFLKEPAVIERYRAFGFENQGAGTLASLRDFLRAELEKWGRITREAGIEPQ